MVAAGESIGAEDNKSILVTDHHIGIGNLGDDVQIQQQLPAGKLSVQGIGRCQIGNDGGVLLQSGYSGVLHIFIYLQLKGCTQNGQGQQQDGGRSKEAAAEG